MDPPIPPLHFCNGYPRVLAFSRGNVLEMATLHGPGQ